MNTNSSREALLAGLMIKINQARATVRRESPLKSKSFLCDMNKEFPKRLGNYLAGFDPFIKGYEQFQETKEVIPGVFYSLEKEILKFAKSQEEAAEILADLWVKIVKEAREEVYKKTTQEKH